MTKQELVKSISTQVPTKYNEVEKIVDLTFNKIMESLVNGDKVTISGFGSFEVRIRKERKGRNPRTGEDLQLPIKKTPAFISGKPLKDALNN